MKHKHSERPNINMESSQQYDPVPIIEEAYAKFNNNDYDGAVNVYLAKIFEWVDDSAFGISDPQTTELIKQGIARLWIEISNLHRLANKAKAAADTFESAINCPVAGSVGSVWLSYAQFQQERGRNKTAQKIFLRALVGEDDKPAAVTSPEEQEQLWDEFLNMMRRLNSDETLTLEQLKAEVFEHAANNPSVPPIKNEDDDRFSKKARLDDSSTVEKVPQSQIAITLTTPNQYQQTSIVKAIASASNVEATASAIVNILEKIPGSIQAEWLARDGNDLPSRPEPLFSPSPPKLVEASGKDLMGTEIALQLIRLLIPNNENDVTGQSILDIIKGCWVMTALKEKEAAKCTAEMDNRLIQNLEKLEADLDARLSVAGGALAAVKQMNENERTNFINQCNQQRQQLQALISWEFRLVSTI